MLTPQDIEINSLHKKLLTLGQPIYVRPIYEEIKEDMPMWVTVSPYFVNDHEEGEVDAN